jgi:uncharacterized protein YecE (DUF72 family)
MTIRVGIGGWIFPPWRGTFYPPDLPHRRELEYASSKVAAIEINATYYRTQTPACFARWRDETPPGFVFTVKGSRFATNRRILADAGESVQRFVSSGITELGAKLGPVVWQFAATKRFDPDDLGSFIRLLPAKQDGVVLRHVLDVRHESFLCSEFIALARRHRIAVVHTDSPDFPAIADRTGDFVYVRLMNASARFRNGYAPKALQNWAARARVWSEGGAPDDLPRIAKDPSRRRGGADVFVFFINGAKESAPAAAGALVSRLATA